MLPVSAANALWACLAGAAASCAAPQASSSSTADARRPDRAVQAVIDAASRKAPPGATIAVAYRDLGTGRTATVRGAEVFHAASTMKVPVMIEVFRRADALELSLEDGIEVRDRFASIADGSPYRLDPNDDSDRELYGRIGSRVAVLELVQRMIERSSNLATNLLIERVGPERVQATIEALGTVDMQVVRGVEDGPAYRRGLVNTATATDLMVLLGAIARGTAASRAACRGMLAILEAQEFNELIPAGLPPGTRVAHKTGWITGIHHDAAIVYPAGAAPYVLVVLTRGYADHSASTAAIAGLSARVYAAHLDACVD